MQLRLFGGTQNKIKLNSYHNQLSSKKKEKIEPMAAMPFYTNKTADDVYKNRRHLVTVIINSFKFQI
jgi:hypothetical protein